MPAESIRIETVFGPVHCSRLDALTVYRVGYKPDPWHWTPWEFADEHGRFDDADDLYPTVRAGELPRAWCESRLICSAELSGWFILIGHYETLPTLRQQFLPTAKECGLQDLDAAAIRDSKHRRLTQAISAWVYTLTTPDGEPTTGIQFDSRHGDQLTLWAIYERSASTPSPPEITNYSEPQGITEHDPDLTEAMRIHHLTWAA